MSECGLPKLSKEEIDLFKLPKRMSALGVVSKIRLPTRSNVYGEVKLELTPYLKKPIEMIGKNKTEVLGLIAPTQSGKTLFLQVVVADSIDQDPGTMFYIMPDEKTAIRAFNEKVIDVVKESPDLRSHMDKAERFALSNKQVDLDNMTIYPAWANSIAQINSIPAKRGILDEVRLMKLSIGTDSNAIKLLWDRLTTYRNLGQAQMYMVSSPSVEGDLLHQQIKITGTTVLWWYVPCPVCGKYQKLDFFRDIIFDKQTKTVKCLCQYCKGEFSDKNMKMEWNNKGMYAPLGCGLDEQGRPIYEFKQNRRMFFRFDSLVSPFRNFKSIWQEYLDTKDNVENYKNFIQAWLALFWKDTKSKIKESTLKDKKENSTYFKGQVLEGTKLITGGIDSQGNGFYVEIRGWFTSKKSYLLDQYFVASQKDIDSDERVAELFKEIQDQTYYTKKGKLWGISLIAVDTGGDRTKQVYYACDMNDRFLKVKGRNQNQLKTINYNQEINLYLVRTYEYLNETDDMSVSDDWLLPQDVEDDYIIQFTQVKKVEENFKKTGEIKFHWKKIGVCDYRFACIHSYIVLDIPTDIGDLRRSLDKKDFSFNPVEERIKEDIEVVEDISDNYFESSDYDDWL